jgi:hypothetical protein
MTFDARAEVKDIIDEYRSYGTGSSAGIDSGAELLRALVAREVEPYLKVVEAAKKWKEDRFMNNANDLLDCLVDSVVAMDKSQKEGA